MHTAKKNFRRPSLCRVLDCEHLEAHESPKALPLCQDHLKFLPYPPKWVWGRVAWFLKGGYRSLRRLPDEPQREVAFFKDCVECRFSNILSGVLEQTSNSKEIR